MGYQPSGVRSLLAAYERRCRILADWEAHPVRSYAAVARMHNISRQRAWQLVKVAQSERASMADAA